jgi:hypothetical protein
MPAADNANEAQMIAADNALPHACNTRTETFRFFYFYFFLKKSFKNGIVCLLFCVFTLRFIVLRLKTLGICRVESQRLTQSAAVPTTYVHRHPSVAI